MSPKRKRLGRRRTPGRRVIRDQKTGLLTLGWAWESECPRCGDLVENLFYCQPSPSDLEAMELCPCDECIERVEKEEIKIHPQMKTKGHKNQKKKGASADFAD